MQVAIYVRVSTPNQAQSQTIEQQVERLQSHCHQQGWELSADHIFRDEGHSGHKLSRPALDRPRECIAHAEVERVLLTAPDRLARKYVHQVLLIEEFERRGCPLEFLDRPMSQDPHDQLVLQIRGAVAEYERALITDRMRLGRLRKLQAGLLLPWSRAPYGYGVDPTNPRDPAGVRLDPTAPLVTELFALYLEPGQSLKSLSRHLMAQQIPAPRGGTRWNPSTLRSILTNPAYTGKVYANRRRTQPAKQRRSALAPIGHGESRVMTPPEAWLLVAEIPPIVSEEQFAAVQAKLAQNQSFAPRNNKSQDYLLRCLVSCGLCQRGCVARTNPPNYTYYICQGKLPPLRSNPDEKCPSRFIPAQQLDQLVWQDLCEILLHPELITHALQRAQGGAYLPQELQARREQLRQAAAHLTQQIDRLTDAYLAEIMPLVEYQARRQTLEQKRQGLLHQLERLETSAQQQQDLLPHMISIENFCQRIQAGLAQATFEQKRQLVELLIDRVVVTHDEVEIRYAIPTSPASEHIRFCHLRTDYFGQFPRDAGCL